MRYLSSLVFALTIIFGGAQELAADDLYKTNDGFFNGRFWNRLSEPSREMFLLGMHEGMSFMPADAELRSVMFCQATVPEVANTADRIFTDPVNAQLPISIAFRVHCGELKGGSRDQSEQLLARMRRIYAEKPTKE